jgi:hypothetical protein
MTNPAPAKETPAPAAAKLSPPYPQGNYTSPALGDFTLNGPRLFLADGSLLPRPVGQIPGIVAKEHRDFSALTPVERREIWDKAQGMGGDGKTAAQRAVAFEALTKLQNSARRKLTEEERVACGLA